MSGFNFDVITLFPKAFELIDNLGVITKALHKGVIDVNLHDLREYGEGSYRQVDDKPYGGGAGMVLKPEPIYKAYESIRKSPKSKTLLMTPQGKEPALIIFLSYGLIGFPTSYFLGFYTSLSVIGIWIGLMVGLFSSSLFLFLRFNYLSKKIIRLND